MKIKVKHGGLTYDSGDLDLKIGDVVLLPALPFGHRDDYESEVIAINVTDYAGSLKTVIMAWRKGVPVPSTDPVPQAELLELIQDANVIVIDGHTFVRKSVWVRA